MTNQNNQNYDQINIHPSSHDMTDASFNEFMNLPMVFLKSLSRAAKPSLRDASNSHWWRQPRNALEYNSPVTGSASIRTGLTQLHYQQFCLITGPSGHFAFPVLR